MGTIFVDWLTVILRTISQILMAGVAITAFSLFLYALAFNLRDRVARTFASIMICVIITFTAESLAGAETNSSQVSFWLMIQWIGIIMLPPVYLHFSNTLLETTGRPSHGKYRITILLSYFISFGFLMLVPLGKFVGPVIFDNVPVPHLQPIVPTYVFTLYYIGSITISFLNFARSFRRTTTFTSRRRMGYLITGALAPAIGVFPFLLFGSGIIGIHGLFFWSLSAISNLVVVFLIIIMAYAVAFFGTPWPDRVVKSRLFKWLMRGPFTASVTLGIVTIVRRLGALFGEDYTAFVPIAMVVIILLLEYVITIFAPLGERILFWGNDSNDLRAIRDLENRLLTRNDLKQFLEMILSGACDRLQAEGGYIASFKPDGMDKLFVVGKPAMESKDSKELEAMVLDKKDQESYFYWGNDLLIPLVEHENGKQLLGLMGISGVADHAIDSEMKQVLDILAERATLGLRDRRLQEDIFTNIQEFSPDMEYIERLRASARYGNQSLLLDDLPEPSSDITQWVRDALGHYWGGPRLTDTPLMQLKIVRDAVIENDGNQANAMRAVLRKAIERTRPAGERRFTADWILYNILDLKFLEGKKVREVALRLSMSEADLYRKQRVAIEAVTKEILTMENQVGNIAGLKGTGDEGLM
ncbi:MAG: histidine kinase N-terminal 7TM domain-containing protein [Anaerolineaceae bacterium]